MMMDQQCTGTGPPELTIPISELKKSEVSSIENMTDEYIPSDQSSNPAVTAKSKGSLLKAPQLIVVKRGAFEKEANRPSQPSNFAATQGCQGNVPKFRKFTKWSRHAHSFCLEENLRGIIICNHNFP